MPDNNRCCYQKGTYKIGPIIQICGEIDEFSCVLGMAKLPLRALSEQLGKPITDIQAKLYRICSHLHNPKIEIPYKWINDIDLDRRFLEEEADDLPHDFTISGDNILPTSLDWARSVCRRCERKLLHAYNDGIEFNHEIVLTWINRVGDLLYLMARRYDIDRTIAKEVLNGTGIQHQTKENG